MAHYIRGPSLHFNYRGLPKTITFAQFENVCANVSDSLGPGYLCVPEEISEGGILFKKYPGRKNKFEYKTCRVYFMDYPFIKPGMNRDTKMCIANPELNSLDTFLKAFHGAPRFTMHELFIITNELAQVFMSRDNFKPYEIPKVVPPIQYRCHKDKSLEKLYETNETCRLAYNKFDDTLKKCKRKWAINRIARNYITDRYLLKVYTKRLQEIII